MHISTHFFYSTHYVQDYVRMTCLKIIASSCVSVNFTHFSYSTQCVQDYVPMTCLKIIASYCVSVNFTYLLILYWMKLWYFKFMKCSYAFSQKLHLYTLGKHWSFLFNCFTWLDSFWIFHRTYLPLSVIG